MEYCLAIAFEEKDFTQLLTRAFTLVYCRQKPGLSLQSFPTFPKFLQLYRFIVKTFPIFIKFEKIFKKVLIFC